MERDLRLTGQKRGQSGNAVAPKGFELNNPWKVRFITAWVWLNNSDEFFNSWRNGSIKSPLLYIVSIRLRLRLGNQCQSLF